MGVTGGGVMWKEKGKVRSFLLRTWEPSEDISTLKVSDAEK